MADLDFGPQAIDEGWLPLGDAGTPFTARLNGNGFTISNLYINRPTTDNIGLFGYVEVMISTAA